MSRNPVVTKQRRIHYRAQSTPVGEALDVRVSPMNVYKGIADASYEGPAEIKIPVGTEITISNRSGERKKI